MAALVRRELSSGRPGRDHIALPALVSGTDHPLAPIEDRVVFAGSHLPSRPTAVAARNANFVSAARFALMVDRSR